MLTQKQLLVVLKLDLYSSFLGGGGVQAQTTVTRPSLRALFEVKFSPILKAKQTVAKALYLAKRGWLVGENLKRNDSVTVVRN